MIEEIDFETFLHVSNNKYRIFVFDKNNLKNLYSEEIEIYNESNFPDLSNLSKFLDKNIYKIENNLIELKDLFKENYQERTIMHMIVINYIVNGNKYTSFKSNLISDNLCIEVNFISISNELIISLDKILEKYQIKINQYMCGNYIKNFFDKDNSEISLMAYKLKNGYNDNEAILIPKNIENKGFFEKFFQLFS